MTTASSLHRRLASLTPGVHAWDGPELPGTIAAALNALGRRSVLVAAPSTKAGVIDALAAAYRFPAGTGRNWDALTDLLADHAGDSVLVIDVAALVAHAPHEWEVLHSILVDTSAWFAGSRTPFCAIVLGAALG